MSLVSYSLSAHVTHCQPMCDPCVVLTISSCMTTCVVFTVSARVTYVSCSLSAHVTPVLCSLSAHVTPMSCSLSLVWCSLSAHYLESILSYNGDNAAHFILVGHKVTPCVVFTVILFVALVFIVSPHVTLVLCSLSAHV